MNIFAFDDDPEVSALWLDDIRSNKMVVESLQLLSTAMNVLDPNHGRNVYKTSHLNHPCAVWARESADNFRWLLRYTRHLLAQRSTPHKSSALIPEIDAWFNHSLNPTMWGMKSDLPWSKFDRTPFANCAAHADMGISFKHIDQTNYAYRLYIRERWRRDTIKLTWNNGKEPWWR